METWRAYFTLGVLFLILGLAVFFIGLFVNSDTLILIGGVAIALAIACFVLSLYVLLRGIEASIKKYFKEQIEALIKSFLKEHHKEGQEYPYIA